MFLFFAFILVKLHESATMINTTMIDVINTMIAVVLKTNVKCIIITIIQHRLQLANIIIVVIVVHRIVTPIVKLLETQEIENADISTTIHVSIRVAEQLEMAPAE